MEQASESFEPRTGLVWRLWLPSLKLYDVMFDGGEEGDTLQATSAMFSGRPLWASMNAQKSVGDFPAFAGSHEDHGLVKPACVNEDVDEIVLRIGCGFIRADGLKAFQVQRSDGLAHIVLNDSSPEGIRVEGVAQMGGAGGYGFALIEPGKPWLNGLNESFNGKFRDECLSIELVRCRAEAVIEERRWQ